MKIAIWVGTTYNATWEAAQTVAQALGLEGMDATLTLLGDVNIDQALTDGHPVLVMTASHGHGELPDNALPFVHGLQDAPRFLGALRYGMMGLGDSSYTEFGGGAKRLDEVLQDLGAVRLGDVLLHDAQSGDDAADVAIAWAQAVLNGVNA